MYWLKRLVPALLIASLVAVAPFVLNEFLYACGDSGDDHGGSGGPSHDNGQGPPPSVPDQPRKLVAERFTAASG